MLCYFCEKQAGAGGLKYAVRQAVAICQSCGAGVCMEHSAERVSSRGSEPIVCQPCRTNLPQALRESA